MAPVGLALALIPSDAETFLPRRFRSASTAESSRSSS